MMNQLGGTYRLIVKRIKAKGIKVIIYEPVLNEPDFSNLKVYTDLNEFKLKADVIVSNPVTKLFACC